MNANTMMRKLLVAMSAMLAGLNIAGCPVADPKDVENPAQNNPEPQPAPPAPAPKPALFVANNLGAITSYESPAALNGNIAPNINLSGGQTQLAVPYDVLVNSAEQLFAINAGANSVSIYNNARQANGNLEPTRNIAGAATGLVTPTAAEIDARNDSLLVANFGAPTSITIYSGASTNAARGNLAAIRRISSNDLNQAFGLSIDDAGTLYVGNYGVASIAVFDDAANRNGTIAADRVITSPAFAGARIHDVFVNAADTLFVVLSTNKVVVFGGASALNGSVMPDSTLTVSGAAALYGIAVDSAGVGYLADLSGNAILVFDDISTANGTFSPDRTIKGADTQLRSPIRLTIVE
ncbi:MAG: hypothetical protein JNG88_13110 [Phycisphaerales bacterium]|nr:hypothetical protein [Phycisphaerales bacterium]